MITAVERICVTSSHQIRDGLSLNPMREAFNGLVMISRECAEWWLTFNIKNRPKQRHNISECKRLLTQGEWRSDYDVPISFSTQRLINGQHRLIAIAETGISAISTVKTQLSDELYKYMDVHKRRSVADRCEFDTDHKRNRDISAIVTAYHDQIYNSGYSAPGGLDVVKAVEIFEKHREGIEFAAWFMSHKQAGITNATVASAMGQMREREHLYERYADENGPRTSRDFAESLLVKGGVEWTPALLREHLIKNRYTGTIARRDLWLRCVFCAVNYLKCNTIKAIRRCDWDGNVPESKK